MTTYQIPVPPQNPMKRAIELVKNESDKQQLAEFFSGYMEEQAKSYLECKHSNWREMAMLLEEMSEDVREKRFSNLLSEGIQCIQDAWETYERMYNAITPAFVTWFAPRAMTPDDFVFACSCESVEGTMPRLACPCCKSEKFTNNTCFPPFVTVGEKVRVSFFCEGCGFPLDMIMKIQ